jgi:hypothetical protein
MNETTKQEEISKQLLKLLDERGKKVLEVTRETERLDFV